MGRESIRRRTGTVAVAALLLLAPASGAHALVTGASTPVTHHWISSGADEVRSPSDTTIDTLHARGVRRSWAGHGTGTSQEDDSDGGAGQDESGGGGSGGEDGSGQDQGGKDPGGGGPTREGSGDGTAASTTTTSTTSTTTTAPPVTSITAPPPPASSGATAGAVSENADEEDSEPAEREPTPAGGATSPTTTMTTSPPTELRSDPSTGESSSLGSTGGRDVSEPDPALAAALASEESWSFLAGQDVSPSARPNRVETVDPAPNAPSVVLSWLIGRNSNGPSMAVFGPIVVLLTIWDAVASAGSGLAAPASALGTFVILILYEKGHVVDAGARLLGRRAER